MKFKIFTRYFLPLLILMSISLTSCSLTEKFSNGFASTYFSKGLKKFTYNDYITMKYPKDCKLDNQETNGNTTNSFVLNEQNFVILSEEKLEGVDKNVLTFDKLNEIANVYADPFIKQGFNLDYSEQIKMGENDAYKIAYSTDNFTIGYIFWFEKENDPATLYKIMFVYDNEHKDTVMQMIESVELPYK